MTAHGTAENAVEAMKSGAADYLTKPFSMDELRLRVRGSPSSVSRTPAAGGSSGDSSRTSWPRARP